MRIIDLLLALGLGMIGTFPAAELFSAVQTGEYYGETYAFRSPSPNPRFLFFVGETVRLRFTIGNRGPDTDSIRFPDSRANSLFRVEAFRDGVPIALRVAFDDGRSESRDGSLSAFDSTAITRLNAGESVHWQATIDQALTPGTYRVRMVSTAVDGIGAPVLADVSFIEFEIQPASATARPELAVRDVFRHYLEGTPSGYELAEQAIDRLLTLNPTSYVAFMVRGQIARARKDEKTAIENFRRAAGLLEEDQDALLTSFKTRPQRDQLLAAVRSRIGNQQ